MTVNLPSLPFALEWSDGVEPPSWGVTESGLEATAAGKTDWYVYAPDPNYAPNNAARLLGPAPEGEWQFSARVSVDFTGTFDAGTLLLQVDEDHWSKLALEYSPEGRGMVVSVVTRGTSDDANAWTIEGREVWLRISRVEGAFAFHAGNDGEKWEFVRSFDFGVEGPVNAGFGVQAPDGDGCKATFDHIAFKQEGLQDLRDGS